MPSLPTRFSQFNPHQWLAAPFWGGVGLCVVACGGMSATDEDEGPNRAEQSAEEAPERPERENELGLTPDGAEQTTEQPAQDAGTPAPQIIEVEVDPSRCATPGSSGSSANAEAGDDRAMNEEPDAGAPAIEFVDDLSVLVIFDNSGSMQASWGSAGATRWSIANRALYDSLAPVATSLKVAAIRFPVGNECGVGEFTDDVHFGWQLAGEFLAEWEADSLGPAGSTPLGAAFLAADEAIAQASERGLLEERFNVVVLTDGEPNCDSDPALLTQLPAKWLEAGVHTHVLGLPGSSTAATLLNDIAAAGGTGEAVPLAEAAPDTLTDEVTRLTR